MRVLLELAKRAGHRRALALAAVLSALTYLSAVALMGLSAWLLSRAAQHPAASSLALAAVGVRSLGLGRGLARYAERLVGHNATLTAVAELRVAVFQGLVTEGGQAPKSGDALAQVVGDVEAIQDLWLRCLLPWLSAALVSGVCVGAVWWWSPAAGVVLLVGLLLGLTVVPGFAAVVARREAALAATRAQHLERVLDVVHGCADLTVLGEMPRALADAAEQAQALARLDRRSSVRAALLGGLATALQGVTILGVLVVALPAVQHGDLPGVDLAVLALIALSAFEAVTGLAEAGGLLPRTYGAAVRLLPLLRAPARQGAVPTITDEPPRLQAVTLRFPGTPRASVIDVDLVLRPGSCVGVVGGSGAGKSTLLRLLSGQLRATTGVAYVGGVATSGLSASSLSSRVVLAEQEAHLFETSVADNLRLARPAATDQELVDAARAAGLGPWLSSLPEGLLTRVGERGSRVSGGERKRLSVARALLSEAPVLLLDEPTEGLDPVAADALLATLLTTRGSRTLVVVTHRHQMLERFDEVLVLDAGRIVQRGRWERPRKVAVSRTIIGEGHEPEDASTAALTDS